MKKEFIEKTSIVLTESEKDELEKDALAALNTNIARLADRIALERRLAVETKLMTGEEYGERFVKELDKAVTEVDSLSTFDAITRALEAIAGGEE